MEVTQARLGTVPRVPVALCVFVAILYSLADLPFSMRCVVLSRSTLKMRSRFLES